MVSHTTRLVCYAIPRCPGPSHPDTKVRDSARPALSISIVRGTLPASRRVYTLPLYLRPERPRPLRSCRLAGAPRHACWTAELGACTFADRCLPCTMYHVRRPLLDLYLTMPCPHPVLSV
eukprot:scaffold10880_cov64-Phaeocystis_antarctica.AAC.5